MPLCPRSPNRNLESIGMRGGTVNGSSGELISRSRRSLNVQNEFRIRQSSKGYRVELCRDGQPYVTFLDGLSEQNAEREARSLTALWAKIAVPRFTGHTGSGGAVDGRNIPHTELSPAVVAEPPDEEAAVEN